MSSHSVCTLITLLNNNVVQKGLLREIKFTLAYANFSLQTQSYDTEKNLILFINIISCMCYLRNNTEMLIKNHVVNLHFNMFYGTCNCKENWETFHPQK